MPTAGGPEFAPVISEIASPLEAGVVHHGIGDDGVPVRDEDALMRYIRAVVGDRFVRIARIAPIGVRRLEVQEIEGGADAVFGIQLIVQLPESKVLIGEPWLNARLRSKKGFAAAHTEAGIAAGRRADMSPCWCREPGSPCAIHHR